MASKNVLKNVLIMAVPFLALGGCELTKPSAIGGDTQIIVFADSAQWNLSRESLSAIFEREVSTPQPETEFYLQRVDLSLFETYRKYKTIIFLGTLYGDDPVSKSVQNMLSLEAQTAVLNQNYFVFSKKDEWARGQLTVVLATDKVSQMNANLQNYAVEIYDLVDQHSLNIVSDFLYSTSKPLRDKAMPQSIMNRYGWTLQLHPDFEITSELPDSNYVRFHAKSAVQSLQRWICIQWQPVDSVANPDSLLTYDWMAENRARLGLKFVDPVISVPRYDRMGPATFAGRPALRYDGVWKTVSVVGGFGGAFRSYGFFEPHLRSLFFVDMAVFFPEEEKKLKYLREMDAIARTFSTK